MKHDNRSITPAGLVRGLLFVTFAAAAMPQQAGAAVICVPNLGVDISCTASAVSIGAAIAAASGGGGDTVLVGPGLYLESPIIDRSLTLKAVAPASEANAGNSALQAIIDGSGAIYTVTVNSSIDGVVIDGFEIRNPTHATANTDAAGIRVGIDSAVPPTVTVQIENNVIHATSNPARTAASLGESGISAFNIGNGSVISGNTIYDIADSVPPSPVGESLGSGRAQGILIKASNGTASGVDVDGNTLHDVRDVAIRFNGVMLTSKTCNVTNNQIHDIGSAGTGFLSGIGIDHSLALGSIAGNTIDNIVGGFGLGVQATLTTSISGNRITSVVGGNLSFPGAGILVNTNGVSVTDNYLSANAVGIVVNSTVSSGVVASANCIDGNPAGGLVNGSSSTVTASGNWWGCPAGANTPGCDTATDTGGGTIVATPASGVPSCSQCGTPRHVATTGSDAGNDCLSSLSPCATVQHAVDVACDFNTVQVAAGIYPEQVSIPKPLTVQGAGADVTVIRPNAVSANTTNLVGAAPIAAIVLAGATTGVSLNDFTVDGSAAAFGACSPGYMGVFYRNASGAADSLHVTNVFHPGNGGCQAVVGFFVQSGGGSSSVALSNSTIDNYGKNGITCNEVGTTCTLSANLVVGRGPLGLGEAAQNGIQLGGGSAGSAVGNEVHGNNYTPQTYCATGILVVTDGVVVQDNVLDGNLCDLLAQTSGSTIHGNVIDPALDYPFSILGDGNDVALNVVKGSVGVGVYVDGINNTFTCNRVTDNAGGFFFDSYSGPGTPNELHNNSILDNGVGVDASLVLGPPDIEATGNWWGCPAGPGGAGCDSVTANVDATAPATAPPPCVSCSVDTDCDDTLACNGAETCNTGSGMCQAGTPVDCSPQADQCNDAACVEPTGTCVVTPKVDGFGCNDGNLCTANDVCLAGVCNGGGGSGDADGDGYCDVQETQAGCNPNDGREIPPQPNVYSGGRRSTRGEVLLTYRAPGDRNVTPATDPSCATVGTCNLAAGFCSTGKVGDPCLANSQCNQVAGTCRLVVNYAETPDLLLLSVAFKRYRQPPVDMMSSFTPVTPGCSRKVDISLPPAFRRARLLLKASGTTSGRNRRDRDRIVYRE